MAQTSVPFGDPKAQKKWGANLAVNVKQKSYWGRRFIGTGENNVVEQKNDLTQDSGDKISFDLSVHLKGQPVFGDNRVDGTAENLKFYTDEVIIDQVRKQVSAGGKMSRKRTVHNLRTTARRRQQEYMTRFMDELLFIYISGARGANPGFIMPTTWTGHAGNEIQAPDASHVVRGAYRTSSALITTADVMNRVLIEGVNAKAAMLHEADIDNADMVPIDIDGENRFCLLMSKWQEHDMRVLDTTGWVQIQRDLASADGKANALFKGGLGMVGGTVLHSHERVIRFTNYGAGSNVHASRALYMGRQAAVIAFGSPNNGVGRFEWHEEMKDAGNEPVVTAGCIMGVKKTRFNGRDFGVIAVDTAAKDPAT